MPSAYFLAARAVVNEVDPVGLIDMGAPDDEYDAEVEDLIKWREPVTAARVAEVFIRWFGQENGEMPADSAARIAEGINAARAAHPPPHLKAYVCTHVFKGERPVLYVTRADGDWCFLCGGEHADDASSYRVVGIGHVVEGDATLAAILDLEPDEEAERLRLGDGWTRSRI